MLLAPPLCWSCRAPAARTEPLCPGCRRRLRPAGPLPQPVPGLRVAAPLVYEGPARDLVRALKFRGAVGLADAMAALMIAAAPAGLLRGALVPVPLHPVRRRARGFNQAERLARALARRTGLPVLEFLPRRGTGRRQVGRGRGDRLAGPQGSIRAGARVPIRAVLIDDVVTTGATLRACAGALRAAGVRDVEAFAFARTPAR